MEVLSRHQKKQKVTFGLVIVTGILLLIFDIAIALSPFKGTLYGLGVLEIIGVGALTLRAIWDALPRCAC